MDIYLLGPELEKTQGAAQKELTDTIEKRKKEVEQEVIDNLSEIASDGRRVLKSQKQTYEMMLDLDGLVRDNEDLFLRVNALCTKTGVSLNAIIDRMVEKNREKRVDTPVVKSNETTVEIPKSDVTDKKKVGSDVTGHEKKGLNYRLDPEGVSGVESDEEKRETYTPVDLSNLDLSVFDSYDPDKIQFDWQKQVQSELDFSQTTSTTTSTDEGPSDDEFTVAVKEETPVTQNVTPMVAPVEGVRKVRGRRLHTWRGDKIHSTRISILLGEDLTGRSEDYIRLNEEITSLQLTYMENTPDDAYGRINNIDIAIGESKMLDVNEKRRLYKKLNSVANKVERYARMAGASRR